MEDNRQDDFSPSDQERTVICEDALVWLKARTKLEGCSLVASLPDRSEFPNLSLTEWKDWFQSTARLIMSRCPNDGVCFFYQTDIKVDGHWIDKAFLIQKVAEESGMHLLWHKVACRSPAGTATFGRPSYSHILCFSEGVKADVSRSTPDVLPDLGEKTWERGMGMNACQMIAKFVLSNTSTRTIVHPFCGEGAMLAVANAYGLSATGIERSPKRAEKARLLQVDMDISKWL